MIKKFGFLFKIFLCLVVLVFFFTNHREHKNEKIEFWTLQLSGFGEYINDIISDFESNKQENIPKIKWIDIPYAEGEKRTLASILSDNPPNLINLTPDFSILLAQKKALSEIPKEKLQNYNLTEALSYNGKYYGIPFYATSSVTLCNKSILPKSNKIPKTYDELLKMEPESGKYITMISFSENDTLLKILNKYGINSPDTINSSKSIELFKIFKNAFDKGYIPVESVTQGHREALEKYMSGQLIFLVTGANFINMIKENAPDVYNNTVVLPQLTGDSGKYDFSLMNFIIPQNAKYKEKALEFALFFTNAENQIKFSKLTSVLPVNRKSLDDDFFKISKSNDLQSQARIISAKQLNNMQPPIKNIRNKKNLNILSSQVIQGILINNKDIKESLNFFSEEWKKLDE